MQGREEAPPRRHPFSSAAAAPMASAFVGLLSGLPPRQAHALYRSPWACLAVLRALPPLAKQYVMRLLYVESPVEVAELDAWARPDAREKHAVGVSAMRRLRVLVPAVDDAGGGGGFTGARVRLNPRFRRGLRVMLERSFVDANGEGVGGDDDLGGRVPSHDSLDAYARSRWEALVLTLTGASDAFAVDADYVAPTNQGGKKGSANGGRAPLDVGALFRSARLVGDTSKGEREGVTEAGFRFLLTTAREQIWLLLTQYIASSYVSVADTPHAGDDPTVYDADADADADVDADVDLTDDAAREHLAPAVIGFLLQLTFQHPGRAYPTDGLPPAQRAVVSDLAHLGLLYLLSADGKGYYVPTYLTAGLSSGASEEEDGAAAGGGGAGDGHVIVETNYRVYAYTTSAVEVEILRLFTRPDYLLPNLYVGMLTREAVLEALSSGISADQIVQYLRTHAHPQTRKKGGPAVPLTVSDQIRLWARERTRVKEAPAVLYCDFPTETNMYDKVAAAAVDRGVLLWEDREGKRLAVTAGGHDQMREVFRRIRAGEM